MARAEVTEKIRFFKKNLGSARWLVAGRAFFKCLELGYWKVRVGHASLAACKQGIGWLGLLV